MTTSIPHTLPAALQNNPLVTFGRGIASYSEVKPEHIAQLLTAAQNAPNHKRTWPARFAVVSGVSQLVLGNAIADVFDALSHHRVYKHAWPVEEAEPLEYPEREVVTVTEVEAPAVSPVTVTVPPLTEAEPVLEVAAHV